MDPGRLGSRMTKSLVRLLSGTKRGQSRTTARAHETGTYPGDFTGEVDISYSPHLDTDADPGEIVWGWIPFEDDHTRGKDRPCLVIGRDGKWLLVLMLTSQDKDLSTGDDDRHETWVDIGSGPWDRERRPSEVRVDRIVRLAPQAVRREGAVLGRDIFDTVAVALRSSRR